MFDRKIQAVMDRVDDLRHTTDDHMQIPKAQARLMAQLVRIGGFRSVCEVGVSYGYSTLHWSAVMAETGGHVHGVDVSEKKINAATEHLTQAGLIDRVTLHLGDAREVCKSLAPEEPFDFVFIDARKEESIEYLDVLMDKLAPRCVIAADNTGNLAERMKPYVRHVRSLAGVVSCDVPIAHGFELSILDRR